MLKNKQFVVIGLGRFGVSVATTLAESGYEVMAIDINEEVIQEISSVVTHAVQADVTDVDTLNSLGIRNFDIAIVAIGRDIQSSIMVTLLLKEMGIQYVVAKASSDLHEKVLQKLGADKIISPEQDMGVRIANSLISGSIVEHIQLSPEYSIVEIVSLPAWNGKTIREINMRAAYGINVIAIERDKEISITPGPDFLLLKNDILVVVGANKKIEQFS